MVAVDAVRPSLVDESAIAVLLALLSSTITVDAPGARFENREDPGLHLPRSNATEDRVVIWKRVANRRFRPKLAPRFAALTIAAAYWGILHYRRALYPAGDPDRFFTMPSAA